MAMYMCDGIECGFTNSDEEVVVAHVNAQACVNAWGVMEVGGPAHQDFQKGIHPMGKFVESVAKHYLEAVLVENGIVT